MKKESGALTEPPKVAELLKAQNIFLRSPGSRRTELLKNISLQVGDSELKVLQGPPAGGKTKLLQVLAARILPSSGKLFFKKKDLYEKKKRLKHYRQSRIYLSKKPLYISSKSVYENLYYILRISRLPRGVAFDRIMHVLKITGLIPKRELYPGDLSSSEKLFFKLAAALLRDPELMFLDFNLSGETYSAEIIEILKRISSIGCAVLISAGENSNLNIPERMCLRVSDGEIC